MLGALTEVLADADPADRVHDRFVTKNPNTLATALYVKIDDFLKGSPHLVPWRPKVGIEPTLSDADLIIVGGPGTSQHRRRWTGAMAGGTGCCRGGVSASAADHLPLRVSE